MSLIHNRFGIAETIFIALLLTMVCSIGMSRCAHNADNDTNKRIRPDIIRGNEHKRRGDFYHPEIRKRAAKAYTSGLAAVMQEPVLTVGDVWVLQEILKCAPDKVLRQFVNNNTARLSGDPFLRLINPTAPLMDLPVDPGVGATRFYNFMLAPFGRPEERAISFINDFLSTDESGYALTHQFLVLEWAEQMGLEFPKQMSAKKQKLQGRILQEQLTDKSFSDLYAERVAILLRFTEPEPFDVTQWVQTIVNAQLQDGSWGLYSGHLAYDRQSVTGKPGVIHTIVLVLLTLRIYLDKY